MNTSDKERADSLWTSKQELKATLCIFPPLEMGNLTNRDTFFCPARLQLYPGSCDDERNLLTTLGGLSNVNTVFSSRLFRPEAPCLYVYPRPSLVCVMIKERTIPIPLLFTMETSTTVFTEATLLPKLINPISWQLKNSAEDHKVTVATTYCVWSLGTPSKGNCRDLSGIMISEVSCLQI